jgi:phage terminase large subunit-like protein
MRLLGSLVLEDGRHRAEVATPEQRADAEAALDEHSAVRFHLEVRSRGYSKSTDAAGVGLAALLTQAPPMSRSYAVAADRDQGRLLLDCIQGFVARSPGLADLVRVDQWKVTVLSTGAALEVLSADLASAWGVRPFMVVADEVANWGASGAPERIWEALSSAIPKTNGRLLAITSAGSPDHWAYQLREHAQADPVWRLSEIEGPPPWTDPALLAEQERRLPASLFARLFRNIWTAPEDRLARADDLRACAILRGPLPPEDGIDYVVTVDVGVVHDRTAVVVAHAERLEGDEPGVRVVCDRLRVWQGSHAAPVQLPEVGEAVADLARTYNDALVLFDPHQAVELSQRLGRRGIRTRPFNFTGSSVGELGLALHTALRNRTVAIPDDPDLLSELASVRLRETTPGTFRLDSASGGFDDQAVALAMAVRHLQRQRTNLRASRSFVPTGRIDLPSRDPFAGSIPLAAGDRIGGLPDPRRTLRVLNGRRHRRSTEPEPVAPLPEGTIEAHDPGWRLRV